jgi:hypothetical protein
MAFPRADNGTRNSSRKPFFAELKNRVGQLRFRPSIDKVSCGPAHRLIHPHVQRTIDLKAEAASRFFQLQGRNSKVKQDSIDLANTTGGKMLFQIHKMPMEQEYAVTESCEPFSTG